MYRNKDSSYTTSSTIFTHCPKLIHRSLWICLTVIIMICLLQDVQGMTEQEEQKVEYYEMMFMKYQNRVMALYSGFQTKSQMGYYLFEFKGKMEEFQKLLKVDADKWYDKKRQRQQKIGQSAGVKDVGENGSGYDSDQEDQRTDRPSSYIGRLNKVSVLTSQLQRALQGTINNEQLKSKMIQPILPVHKVKFQSLQNLQHQLLKFYSSIYTLQHLLNNKRKDLRQASNLVQDALCRVDLRDYAKQIYKQTSGIFTTYYARFHEDTRVKHQMEDLVKIFKTLSEALENKLTIKMVAQFERSVTQATTNLRITRGLKKYSPGKYTQLTLCQTNLQQLKHTAIQLINHPPSNVMNLKSMYRLYSLLKQEIITINQEDLKNQAKGRVELPILMFYLPVMVNNVEKSPAEKDCLDLLQPIQAHLLALTATFNAVLNDREKFGRSTEHFLQRLLDKLYTARKVLQSYSFLKVQMDETATTNSQIKYAKLQLQINQQIFSILNELQKGRQAALRDIRIKKIIKHSLPHYVENYDPSDFHSAIFYSHRKEKIKPKDNVEWMKDKELQDYDDYNSDEEEGLAADLVQRRKNIEARYQNEATIAKSKIQHPRKRRGK